MGGFDRQLRALAFSPFVSQRMTMLSSKERYEDLISLSPPIEAGEVVPVVEATYPFTDVPEAMCHLEAGHARGKIAITI
jgi:NADPH:quinone reductase-like Zn-dependent oxidoreductase